MLHFQPVSQNLTQSTFESLPPRESVKVELVIVVGYIYPFVKTRGVQSHMKSLLPGYRDSEQLPQNNSLDVNKSWMIALEGQSKGTSL